MKSFTNQDKMDEVESHQLMSYFDLADLKYCTIPLFEENWGSFTGKIVKHNMLHRKEWIMGFLFFSALKLYAKINGVTTKDKPLYWLTLLYMYVDGAMDIDNISKETLYESYVNPTSNYWKKVHRYKSKLESYNKNINFLPLLQAQIDSSERGDWNTALSKGKETGNLVDLIVFGEIRDGGDIAAVIQLVDDLMDIPEDIKANITTPATTAYKDGTLTTLLNKTSQKILELPQPYPIFFSYAIAYIVQKYPTHINGYNKLREPSFDPLWNTFLREEINVRCT